MKRLHVNVSVKDLSESINFYNAIFKMEPTVVKKDYAKWLVEDPSVNFSIILNPADTGVKHLGIEAETASELQDVYQNIEKTKAAVDEEGHTVCCYAQSEKSWVEDPQGVEWEAFHTYGEADTIKENSNSDCCESTCCS